MAALRRALVAILALVLTGSLVGVSHAELLKLGRTRIHGSTRIQTSAAISREAFPETAKTVYLARMDVFADALAGGALMDGPILLVPSDGEVPASVMAEIWRLKPQEVIALGGQSAVSERMLQSAAGGRKTGRIGGKDRVETSIMIAKRRAQQGPVSEVYLADGLGSNGQGSPDPLAGSALTKGGIYIYTPGSEGRIAQALEDVKDAKVLALGGARAIPDASLAAIAKGRPTERLAGADRYATAAAIALKAFPKGAKKVYIASGTNYADAVAAGSLSDGPLLLVPPTGRVPQSVLDAIKKLGAQEVIALGGEKALSDDVLDQAAFHKEYVEPKPTDKPGKAQPSSQPGKAQPSQPSKPTDKPGNKPQPQPSKTSKPEASRRPNIIKPSTGCSLSRAEDNVFSECQLQTLGKGVAQMINNTRGERGLKPIRKWIVYERVGVETSDDSWVKLFDLPEGSIFKEASDSVQRIVMAKYHDGEKVKVGQAIGIVGDSDYSHTPDPRVSGRVELGACAGMTDDCYANIIAKTRLTRLFDFKGVVGF